jgi:hypothetical protein
MVRSPCLEWLHEKENIFLLNTHKISMNGRYYFNSDDDDDDHND